MNCVDKTCVNFKFFKIQITHGHIYYYLIQVVVNVLL